MVKLWGYDEGICNYHGLGHSGAITKVPILFTIKLTFIS